MLETSVAGLLKFQQNRPTVLRMPPHWLRARSENPAQCNFGLDHKSSAWSSTTAIWASS